MLMFSKSFDEAGERIMSVTRSPWIAVWIVLGVLAIVVVAFLWWRSRKKQRNLEDEVIKWVFYRDFRISFRPM